MFIFLFRAAMIVIAVILIIAGCFDQYGESRKSKKAALLGIIPLAVFLLSMCIVYVPSNNVGIRWSAVGGTSDKTLNEGIAIKSPIDKVFLIPTTVEERTIKKVNVQTKDAQFVTSEVNVKFRVNQKDAFKVYKRYTTLDNLKQNIISNYAQKSIETVVTQYNVIDVLGAKKNEVYKMASKDLQEMLKSEGVEYVNMINEVITPMNPFTAPLAAAALGFMRDIVMKELDSEGKSVVKSTEMLLKVSTRSEKVPYHK